MLAFSCVREEPLPETGDQPLFIRTSVASEATKVAVPSDQALREDAVDSLNVYFYGTFQGDASPSLRHFLLKADTDKTGATSWQVSADWRAEGFVKGNSYEVYVSANSRRVKPADQTTGSHLHTATGKLSDATISDLAGLKSMVEFDYDPSADNGEGGHKPFWGAHDEDNLNPGWLNLHKKYTAESFDFVHRYFTRDKKFLMDGHTTFTAGSGDAIPVELVRAAAKVMVEVKFDESFLAALSASSIALSGSPAWKFYNFSFSTPVFDPAAISGSDPSYNQSIFTSGAIIMGALSGASSGFADNDLEYSSDADRHFSFATYTYPLSWSASGASTEAPAIILSLGYEDLANPGNVSYQVYKVPVVDPESGVTEIGRNKLYRIKATIASEGGELLTDAYKVRCDYDVIPWGDAPADASAIGQVDHIDNDYLDVSPTDVVLRGDGLQTAEVNIIKPNKRSIKMQYCSSVAGADVEDPFPTPAGADVFVEYPFTNNIAENAPAPYYFNYIGALRNGFNEAKTAGGVTYGTATYLQNKFVRGDKTLTVQSYFLPNMAIKYMKVRVYLDVTDWESKGLYRDITFTHYPTNFITAKDAAWASRISAVTFLDSAHPAYEAFNETMRGPEEYKLNTSAPFYDRSVYNGMSEDERGELGLEACTEEQYNAGKAGAYPNDYQITHYVTDYSDYSSQSSNPLYERFEEEGRCIHNDGDPHVMGNGVRANNKHQYNSEADARDCTDGWRYWGEGTATSVGTQALSLDTDLLTTDVTDANFDVPSYSGPYDYYEVNITRTTRYVLVPVGYTYTATFTFYQFPIHKRARYTRGQYERMAFVSVEYVPNDFYLGSSTSYPNRQRSWVNWDVHQGVAAGTASYRVDSRADNGTSLNTIYYAMAYDSGVSKRIDESGALRNDTGRENNHLYIVQTAEPNSSIVLGRPHMDKNGFSHDKVTSPAFMLASQVGSTHGSIERLYDSSLNTDEFGATGVANDLEKKFWAARHCDTYLEVGADGTYYKDWRLPTPDEIRLLVLNQGTTSGGVTTVTLNGFSFTGDDRIIDVVLAAGNYYAADHTTREATGIDTYGVRCVRDLTQAEIDALNN